MKRSMVLAAFTQNGMKIAERLATGFSDAGWACSVTGFQRGGAPGRLKEWTQQAFQIAGALVFVGATGIAVRSIAPFLQGKDKDPAVLVCDDTGRFVISLLSGHLGGANRLAQQGAELLGAVPVITTATDNAGLFSVDEWAGRNGLAVCGLPQAKAVSASLLAGGPVGFTSDFPVQGALPHGLTTNKEGALGIQVTLWEGPGSYDETLFLVPRIVTLGIGCRKGTPCAAIQTAVTLALQSVGLFPQAVAKLHSIDLKQDEPGLLEYSALLGVSFVCFSAEQLAAAPGEFTSSGFVQQVTGVDNVCERSAAMTGGQLILRKFIHAGVTVAAAAEDYCVVFDKGAAE